MAAKRLDDLRARIDELNAEIGATADAIIPVDELAVRLRERLTWQLAHQDVGARYLGLAAPVEGRLPLELDLAGLTWLLGVDQVADLFTERLMAMQGYEPGLPVEQRRRRIAELEKERFTLEVNEELELLRIRATSSEYQPRREEADPRAILEAWDK